MEKIAWITDTSSGFNLDEMKDLFVVPMGVIVNNQHYQDQTEITTDEFYELLKDYGDGAKTTQPNFQDLKSVYEKVEAAGYTHIIAVHPSAELTGSFQNSVKASQDVKCTSAVIDSRIGSYPIKAMITQGMKMNEQDIPFEEIVLKLKGYAKAPVLFLQPKNLSQMKKSGRVTKSQSIVAGLLNIQLILKFRDGLVEPIDKVRTKKKVIDKLKEHVKGQVELDQPETIAVVYAGDRTEADIYADWLREEYNDINITVEPLVPVAGVHLGYGTVGIGWIKENEAK